MVNTPPALIPSLVDSLLQDIDWAAANAPKAERASFNFTRLVLLCHVSLSDSGGAGSSSGADEASRSGGGKKRKRAKEEAEAAMLDSLEFAQPEEQLLATTAEWMALLNGPGRSRQLLIVTTPAAMREAVPGLQTLMGSS